MLFACARFPLYEFAPNIKQLQSGCFLNIKRIPPSASAKVCVPAPNQAVFLFAGVRAGSLPHRELLRRAGGGRRLALQKLQPEEQQQ